MRYGRWAPRRPLLASSTHYRLVACAGLEAGRRRRYHSPTHPTEGRAAISQSNHVVCSPEHPSPSERNTPGAYPPPSLARAARRARGSPTRLRPGVALGAWCLAASARFLARCRGEQDTSSDPLAGLREDTPPADHLRAGARGGRDACLRTSPAPRRGAGRKA